MKRIMSTILCACAVGFVQPVLARVTFTEISGNVVFPLDGGQNVAGTNYMVTGNTTLKLTGTATDGKGTVNAGFWIPDKNVTVTVDASEVEGLTHLVLRNSLRGDGTFRAGAGIMKVSFGGSFSRDNILNLKALEARLTMAESAGKVELVEGISLMRWPEAVYSVAEGAVIAPFADGLFGDELTLDTYDLHVAYPNAVKTGCKITVKEGRTIYHRSCTMYAPDDSMPTVLSQWCGSADTTRTFDVILDGGRFEIQDRTTGVRVQGSITGRGEVLHSGTSEVILTGVFDFAGELRCSILETSNGKAALRLRAAEGSDFSKTDIVLTGTGKIRPSQVTFETAAEPLFVRSLACLSNAGYNLVSIGTGVSVSFGTVSGPVSLIGGDGRMTVEEADATAEVNLKAGSRSSLWNIKSQCEEPLRITSVEEGVTDGELVLDGPVQVEDATGLSKLTIASDATVTYAAPGDLPEVENRGGTLDICQDPVWQRQAALWLDASVAGSFSNAALQAQVIGEDPSTVDSRAIYEWFDCRPSQRTYRIRAVRYDKPITFNQGVFPRVYTDDVDGRPYVCWYDINRTRTSVAGSTYNAAGITLSAKCVIAVFGSQLGGGCAMLCESSARLARVGSDVYGVKITNANKPSASAPICLDAAVDVRTNGVAVVGSETGMSGGWQLVTLSSETAFSLTGIGNAKNPTGSDGNGLQNFREIVVFTEMPSAETIQNVERYLAKKWNLPYTVPTVPRALPVSGSGMVRLDGDATYVADDYFTGTIDLNGNRYEIGAGRLPITAADVPAANRMLWVDPKLDGAVVLVDDVSRPDKVRMIYARGNAGLLKDSGDYYMISPYDVPGDTWDSGKADRRVRWTDGWLDFLNGYGEWGGNMLAIRKLPNKEDMSAYTQSAETLDGVRGGFFALDSSRGGGSLMLTQSNGGKGVVNGLSARGASSPVWELGTDSTITFDTWLDGQSVDGMTQGFSGTKEVMSFGVKDDGSFKYKTMGYCAPSEKYVNNMEIIGEFILYSQPLATADRENVEAYLMKKWLGRVRTDYTEPRDLTIAGAGTLAVATGDLLPKLAAEFTGSIEVTGATWAFTLVQGTAKAKEAWECPDRTVTAPAAVTVDLDVSAARQGKFLLASAGTFAEGTEFSLGTLVNPRDRTVELVREDNALYATVEPKGLLLIVK